MKEPLTDMATDDMLDYKKPGDMNHLGPVEFLIYQWMGEEVRTTDDTALWLAGWETQESGFSGFAVVAMECLSSLVEKNLAMQISINEFKRS